MTRRPNLKLLEATMTTTELPATRPVLVESESQRIAWRRQINDARDEQQLILEQTESLRRINAATKTEAQHIRDARIAAADHALDREISDADKIMGASIEALDRRRADLDKVVAGLEAAMGASE